MNLKLKKLDSVLFWIALTQSSLVYGAIRCFARLKKYCAEVPNDSIHLAEWRVMEMRTGLRRNRIYLRSEMITQMDTGKIKD